MFQLIVFLLVALFILDHNIKNRRFCFLYYKNNHRFSVGVVIRFYHDGIEKLFKLAKGSQHDFYFVNINQAVPESMFNEFGLNFIQLETNLNPMSPANITKIQSLAYHEVYPMLESDFLLFMDANNEISKIKTIDFMANNLVEHQVFTVKETIERTKGEFHLLYYDFFKDMNLEKSNLNYYFFAIKKATYELAKCHQLICENDEDIEEALFKKNIHIVMVDHGQAITRANPKRSFKASLSMMIHYIVKTKRLLGLNRMSLFLVILNVYYISILLALLGITDFDPAYIVITLLLMHILLYLSLREYAKHHAFAYIFAPFTLLLFNGVYVFSLLKRRFKKPTDDVLVTTPKEEDLVNQEAPNDEATKIDQSPSASSNDEAEKLVSEDELKEATQDTKEDTKKEPTKSTKAKSKKKATKKSELVKDSTLDTDKEEKPNNS
ncbi:MAG: hypothetical protein ACLFRI_07025 [Candidatus Izemoplasmataceae bacterium]